mgnify:CR=1 FL=1
MKDKQKEMEMCRQVYEQPHMSGEQLQKMKDRIEEAKMDNRRGLKKMRAATVAAAAVAAFIILPNTSAGVAHAMEQIPVIGRLVNVVTFRDYQYEDERNQADIEIPEIVPESVADTVVEESADEAQTTLQKSADEINVEIQQISEQYIKEFEDNLKMEGGYQNVMVKPEIVSTTQDYFTLKLICYQGAGSGAEWNYYYTIDLNTGERLQLKDLFKEGADYITPISENIKEQMREQMASDENKMYWLDDAEVEEWNFKQITDDTAFYLNEKGDIVISFDEGDVAPMYMGVVTFEIPEDVVENIRK